MEPPRTYAQWVDALDRFGEGDDTVLDAMTHGVIEWQPGVAERWTRLAWNALEVRLKRLSHSLQLSLTRAAGEPTAIGQAMLSARRSLGSLRAFAELSCIPADVRASFGAELGRWARESQASLEKSAMAVRTDHGRLLKIVRDHALDVAAPRSVAVPSSPPPGRRVLY